MNKHVKVPFADTSKTAALDIMVRGFVPTPSAGSKPAGVGKKRKSLPPSQWTLLFDCETTIDERQALRFGTYQIRKASELMESGIFYDPGALTEGELHLLRQVAAERGVKLRTRDDFIEDVFFDVAYDYRANIVGFNLPFDLSRISINANTAKGKAMKGGFSFQVSADKWKPRVQVRHLNSRASLMQFSLPRKQRTPRGARRRGDFTPGRRGSFIDLKTIAAALFSRSFGLASLAEFLDTPTRKLDAGGHGGPLTATYIDYALQDAQVTWECFEALVEKYALHQLSETRIGKILSEASLGKAYLRQMGVKPFKELQPDFPFQLTGKIMSTYYGGRSEIAWRRIPKQVLYCDFLSMYPTVCTLMGLWRFVIAKGVNWSDATQDAREMLGKLTLADLKDPELWRKLTMLVKVSPDKDLFPIRAKYDQLMPGSSGNAGSATIGVNLLSSDQPLWFTLADVIAAKVLSGKTPTIIEAVHFTPREPQDNLKPIHVAGNKNCKVDPYAHDFYKQVIELRASVKKKLKGTNDARLREELKVEEQALKILANSTSYGIFVELIVSDLDRSETRTCYGPNTEGFSIETTKDEEAGRFFHPLVGTLITGAARLMLAIAERLTLDNGLDWAFCDTDSMAIAKPDDMSSLDFLAVAQGVRQWFDELNPYEMKGPLFKVEDANYRIGTADSDKMLEPLYCLALSAKRYVLFNLDANGVPIIRKASAHGLGHLLSPYTEDNAPASIPKPSLKLDDIGVERWHYDLWFQIIRAHLDGHPDEVDLSYHPALDLPAVSRYGASTPKLLGWFKNYNRNRTYRDRVKPFNFLLVFQTKPHFPLSVDEEVAAPKRGRRPKKSSVKPVAPFDEDVFRASQKTFDRETGKCVSAEHLKTYREALMGYHLSAESKFENGDHFDRGRTGRRHIRATTVTHIGKEANKWEEQYFTGLDLDEQIEYGAETDVGALEQQLRALIEEVGEREAAARLGFARNTLRKMREFGALSVRSRVRDKVAQRLQKVF